MGFPGGSDSKESACSAGDLGQKYLMEKAMVTHSSMLAWRIPWTEGPGGLQSMWSQRVGHNFHFSLFIVVFITWVMFSSH